MITDVLGLMLWFAVSSVAAAIGAFASVQAGTFYAELTRPAWGPPATVFGPVWTVLYALMAVSAWLVWRHRALQQSQIALLLFLSQLVLNALWSWLFFSWKLGALSFIDIVALCLLLIATLVCFWRVSRLAGLLLVPYLAWVTFATVLNYQIWRLNPSALG